MCNKVLSTVLVLALSCACFGRVIGDFEDGLDGFEVSWEGGDKPTLAVAVSDIGATTGSGSLAITPHNGWAWMCLVPVDSLEGHTTVSCDVTWVASEWEPQEGIWVNFKEMAGVVRLKLESTMMNANFFA